MIEQAMTVRCDLPLLIAQANVERTKRKEKRLSLRVLAAESGVSLSTLDMLNQGKSKRIDYETVDKLLTFFNKYITVTTADLLVWEPAEPAE